jgi:hypothetical protein
MAASSRSLAVSSAALAAFMVFAVFGATSTNAVRSPKKHGVMEKEVTVDGQLVKTDDGWVIRLKALNAGSREQDCKVATALRSVTSYPMSRTEPTPTTLWKSTVAVHVPASGESEQDLSVPTKVAKQIKQTKKVRQDTEEEVPTTSYSVSLKANCDPKASEHVI